MQIGPETYLVEDPCKPSLDDFLNHSCDPNLGFVDGSLTLYALRDIESGEEVCFDYSTTMNEPGWVIRCRCHTPICRRAVRSYCDLSERDRRRLRSLLLGYLRHAIPANEVIAATHGVAIDRRIPRVHEPMARKRFNAPWPRR